MAQKQNRDHIAFLEFDVPAYVIDIFNKAAQVAGLNQGYVTVHEHIHGKEEAKPIYTCYTAGTIYINQEGASQEGETRAFFARAATGNNEQTSRFKSELSKDKHIMDYYKHDTLHPLHDGAKCTGCGNHCGTKKSVDTGASLSK